MNQNGVNSNHSSKSEMLRTAVLLLLLSHFTAIRADENECKVVRKIIIEPLNTYMTARDLSFVEVGKEWQNSTTASWGCTDSRSTNPMLFTAGGDSGEFILALAVYDKINNQVLSSMPQDELNSAVFDWFTSFINTTGTDRKIFLHVNQHTVIALRNYLNNPSLNIDCVASELWTQALIPLTQNSGFTGCSHIQMMQDHASNYETSPNIVTAYLRAFYRLHWANCINRPTMLYVTNVDGQAEIAVLNVYTEKTKLSKDDKCYNMLPLALPHQRDDGNTRSVLVEYDAIHNEGIRVQLAHFFAAQMSSVITSDTFLAAANTLGDKQNQLTLNYIGPSLPVFMDKIVMGENRSDAGDDMEETAVEVMLIVAFAILAIIGGFFLYRTYKRRKAQANVVFTINDSIEMRSNSVVEL